MLINSDFRDYYDNCRAYGIDKAVVYNRYEKIFDGFSKPQHPLQKCVTSRPWSWYQDGPDASNPLGILPVYQDGSAGNGCQMMAVLFCGKIYFALQVSSFGKPDEYIWDRSNAIKFIEENFDYASKYRPLSSKRYAQMFEFSGSSAYQSLAIEHNIVTAIITRKLVIIDGKLSAVNFQKVIGSVEAFQQASQWIGGVLTNDTQLPEVEDKYKIQQRGFDKFSFRKMKNT